MTLALILLSTFILGHVIIVSLEVKHLRIEVAKLKARMEKK